MLSEACLCVTDRRWRSSSWVSCEASPSLSGEGVRGGVGGRRGAAPLQLQRVSSGQDLVEPLDLVGRRHPARGSSISSSLYGISQSSSPAPVISSSSSRVQQLLVTCDGVSLQQKWVDYFKESLLQCNYTLKS